MDVESVAVSPDGKLLAVGTAGWEGKEPSIHIVNVVTGEAQLTLTGHEREITSLAFSRDGRLFSGSKDTTIGVWDVGSGMEIKRLDGHQDRVTALAVSKDGTRLVSCTGWSRGGRDLEEFRIWNISKGQTIRKIAIPSADRSVTTGAFGVHIAPDLSFALLNMWDSASGNGLLFLDLATGAPTILKWNSEQKFSDVKACAISSDGKFGVSAHHDRRIRYWNLATKKLLREVQAPRKTIIGLAFSPDGSRLALDQEDGAVRIWDTKTDKEVLQLEATGGRSFIGWGDILFAPSGRWLVTTGGSYCFRWDISTSK